MRYWIKKITSVYRVVALFICSNFHFDMKRDVSSWLNKVEDQGKRKSMRETNSGLENTFRFPPELEVCLGFAALNNMGI